MQKSGKITVKHYLNKRANPKFLNDKPYFPVYLQIIVAGQKAQLKSKIQEYIQQYRGYIDNSFSDKYEAKLVGQMYFTEELFIALKAGKDFPLTTILNDEIHLVTSIIDLIGPFNNENFKLTNFGLQYSQYLKNIYGVLDDSVKEAYLRELNHIFRESSNREEDRKLFRLTNYFIHFTNWNNLFCDFYEMTYEMLPSEIKYIENNLSDDLKLKIKAMMAFYARENHLKRFLDKAEKGMFPTVHYIDWLEKGEEFISREFIKIFGKQKAGEYIDALNGILKKSMNSFNGS